MNSARSSFATGFVLLTLGVAIPATAASCIEEGVITETTETEESRDLSGIATPGDSTLLQAPELHDRASWGTALTGAALAYPTATTSELALFDKEDTTTPLHFFATPHTDAEGVGPLFNQRMCLGCHENSTDNAANMSAGGVANPSVGAINTVNTPVSRANRQGITDYSKITNQKGNSPTAAFTLYGDYSPANGAFTPLSEFGGPLQHDHAVGECNANQVPSLNLDPYLQGGIDPVTDLSPLGERRAMGERAAPPYVARGLMEAIYFGDLVANEDIYDTVKAISSLPPQPDPNICPGDCISGRHNQGRASDNFIGGDNVIRVGRFGLRGVGVTLIQFDIGGTQGEIGLTSPFAPTEQPDVDNPGVQCDLVPDPEITADTVLHLRDMVRNIAPPRQADALYESPPVSQDAIDVQAGAKLFGLDLDAFRSRMTPGATAVGEGNGDSDHGIFLDRQLGCASCHIPIIKTGISPAKVGAKHLSNRWAPIFSDLLIHKNPELPPGRLPTVIPGNLSRNLADYAIPPANTGIADGDEFRTPPLMGLGRVGPPFFHDARVYLNVIGAGSYPGGPPNPPASTVFTSADLGTQLLDVTTFELAVLAAIELHDLPAPPDNDYSKCPNVPAASDICTRASQYRGEARNTMEKFRVLTRAQQMQVVKFLLAL
jgi:CxxC motif-containing protein (DUF1111 family)